MNIKNILVLSLSLNIIACGGGGDGGSGDSDSPSTPSTSQTVLPEIVEEDLNEGDSFYLSSELSPSATYDFKTYKEFENVTYDNSIEMTTGCSIMIYKDYEEYSVNSYRVLEADLILQTYESDCNLDDINLVLYNNINSVMVVYSDDNNIKYEIINI